MLGKPPFFPSVLALAALGLAAIPAGGQTLPEGLDNAATGAFTNQAFLLTGNTAVPSGLWNFTNAESHDDIDAIKAVLPNRSYSRLATTVEGPAVVSYWWKIAAVASFDRLYFSSSNDLASISGEADWQQGSFIVDSGSQTLQWYFERLASHPVGVGAAWVDELEVTPIPNNPDLQDGLEHTEHTIHSTDWTKASLSTAAGLDIAKSGPVGPGGKSVLVLEIEGPAVVQFDWGITSDESDTSQLTFFVDNQEYDSIAGIRDLHAKSFDIGPGTHCLKFRFYRGPGGSAEYTGEHEGFVDSLRVSSFGPSQSLAESVERAGGIYSNSWTRTILDHRDGVDSATVTAPDTNAARRIYVDLPETAGLLTFWTKTETDADKGKLYIHVDGKFVLERSGSGAWQKSEINLPAVRDRMMQAIFFRTSDANANSPNTRVFLDSVHFAPGATNYQPDLSIAPLGRAFLGAGVLNLTGLWQTATVVTNARRPYGQYVIRSRNRSSSDKDKITLRGIGSRTYFDVQFVVTQNSRKYNYSASFFTGRFTTLNLNPNAIEAHEIWVSRRARFLHRTHALTVVGRSGADARKADVVRTLLQIR